MTRILFTQTTFDRLRPRLDGRLECLAMDGQGAVRLDGREIPPDEARPECAFLTNDIFFDSFVAPYVGVLERSDALRWVQSPGAGVDLPMFVMLAEKGVRLTTSHAQAPGMAEYVLWGVLDHYQGGRAAAAEQAAHRWTRRHSREIGGTRWLVIGFGAIGAAVAARAKAFGAHVTGVRRRPGPSPFADAVTTPDRLFEHLGDSDVVVLCTPQTPQTVGMVDAAFLAAMKPGSMLVNVGRGSLVEEDALLAALDAGTPEHALLDVFRTEPLPAGSRFWDHPRVTLTPHGCGSTTGVEARTDDLFLDNLARYLAGEPLLSEISAAEVLAASVER
ncbi:MAG: NAD(P)-dependent oxidoreductase [Sphingomonas sp.]